MTQKEIVEGVMNICQEVFNQSPVKNKEVKRDKMSVYAQTAFIVTLHKRGMPFREIAECLDASIVNTARLNRCYEDRIKKDIIFREFMGEYKNKLAEWGKGMSV